MKYAALLTFLTCVSLVAVAQTPGGPSANPKCGLTRAQAPEIRSIRLGMTTQQLLAMFPADADQQRINQAIKESKRADQYGFGRFALGSDIQVRDSRFSGVIYISIEMVDERVTMFHVAYAGPEWNTVDQFVAKLSEALHLPLSSWDPGNESSKSLKCNGFEVNAYVGRENAVRVQDTSARGVVADRRQMAKEKERQAFRP